MMTTDTQQVLHACAAGLDVHKVQNRRHRAHDGAALAPRRVARHPVLSWPVDRLHRIDSAGGRSVAFVARDKFALTDETLLTASFRSDRFLGGEADIPVGNVRLNGGGWQHRLALSSQTALDEDKTLGVSAVTRFTESEDDVALRVQYRWEF